MMAPRHWVAALLTLLLGAAAWAWPSLGELSAPLLFGWLWFGQASLAEAGLVWLRVAEFGLSLLLVGAGLQWLLGEIGRASCRERVSFTV